MTKKILSGVMALVCLSAFAEVEVESIGNVKTLPSDYPEHWVIAHDAAFMHMINGHYMVLDPAESEIHKMYKGMMDSSFIASFQQSASRNEFYVIETFYSRGNRGERTDVVTIYDPATLSPKGEIVLPKDHLRMNSMPEKYGSTIVGDKFLVISNMSPANSVTIVDLDSREVSDSQLTAGCVLNYPTGESAFTSICIDGSLTTYAIDEAGTIADQTRTDVFFSPADNPVFEKPLIGEDGQGYFIGFEGEVYNVDFSGDEPSFGETWSLFSDEDIEAGYRPGGWQLNAIDDQGLMYVLVHPEGYNGSHKDGGPELRIYDPMKQELIDTIELETWGVSIMATHGESPYILVTNAEMQVDVYQDGEFVHTLAPFGQQTPFLIHATEI